MKKNVVPVPYDDFTEMLTAKTQLEAVKKMIESGEEYCSGAIMALLGIEKEDCACTDTGVTSAAVTATQES